VLVAAITTVVLIAAGDGASAWSGPGSTVVAGGNVAYNPVNKEATIKLTFSTDRGSQPYCDGTKDSKDINGNVKNEPTKWQTASNPGWTVGDGYVIYNVVAWVAKNGTRVTPILNYDVQRLGGGSRSQSKTIDVSGLSPGTYTLMYEYNRIHFCTTAADAKNNGNMTFVIPAPPAYGGYIDDANCKEVTGWSVDATASVSAGTNILGYFSTNKNRANRESASTYANALNGTGSVLVDFGATGMTHYKHANYTTIGSIIGFSAVSNNTYGFTWPMDERFIGSQQWWVTPYIKTRDGANPALWPQPPAHPIPHPFGPCANWSLDLKTTLKNNNTSDTTTDGTINARPNETVTWTYEARQKGPTITNQKIDFAHVNSDGWGGSTNITSWNSPRAIDSSLVRLGTQNRSFTQDDVGKTFCSLLRAQPASSSGAAATSDNPCVSVPYHYPGCDATKTNCDDGTRDCTQTGACLGTLTNNGVKPQTNSNQTSAREGETVSFDYELNMARGPTKSLPIEYRTYAFVLRSGQNISGVTEGPRNYASWTTAQCGGRGVSAAAQKYCEAGDPNNTGKAGLVIYPGTGPLSADNRSITVAGNFDAQPGDKICSYIVINNWSVINGVVATTVSASNIKCIEIVKSPQLQIRGADSYSGARYWGSLANEINKEGGFIGSAYSPTDRNKNRGSWSQYGLLATGSTKAGGLSNNNDTARITSFGSAGYTDYFPGAGGSPNYRANACKLWFANINGAGGGTNCSNPDNAGQFNNLDRIISLPSAALPDIAALNATTITGPTVSLSSLFGTISAGSSAVHKYTSAGNLTITDGTTAGAVKGKTLTIVAAGNVYISGNILTSARDATYANLGEIPVLTIIANNIYIDSNVSYLFGNYIAGVTGDGKGSFHSCATTGGAVTTTTNWGNNAGNNQCSNQLTIGGAIVTKQSPKFQRTFGGGTTQTLNNSGDLTNPSNSKDSTINNNDVAPAEIIDYTPNTFLTPYYNDSTQGANTLWRTQRERGLPARF